MKIWTIIGAMTMATALTVAQPVPERANQFRSYGNGAWQFEAPKGIKVSEHSAALDQVLRLRANRRGDAFTGDMILLSRTVHDLPGTQEEKKRFVSAVRAAHERLSKERDPNTFAYKMDVAKEMMEKVAPAYQMMAGGSFSLGEYNTFMKAAEPFINKFERETQHAADVALLRGVSRMIGEPPDRAGKPGYTVWDLRGVGPRLLEEARQNPKLAEVMGAGVGNLLENDGKTSSLSFTSKLEDLKTTEPDVYQNMKLDELERLMKNGQLNAEQAEKAAKAYIELAKTALKNDLRKEADYKRFEESVSVSRAGFGLYTTLLRNIDPKAARVMSVTGNHAFDLIESIGKLKAEKISAAAFTGNIINLISSILGAIFGGPSDLEVILKELGEVRRDIRELHEDMARMFADVHKHLGAITEHLDKRFDEVEHSLKNGLGNLGVRIDEVRTNVEQAKDIVREEARRLHLNQVDAAIAPIKRTLLMTRDLEDVRDLSAEAARERFFDLYYCATEQSVSGLFAGRTLVLPESGLKEAKAEGEIPLFSALEPRIFGEDVANTEIQTVAQAFERQFTVNLYDRDGQGKALPLPNASLWTACTEGYLRLALHRPEVFLRFDRGRLAQMRTVGARLQRFQERIALGAERSRLGERLLEAYGRVVSHIDAEVEAARTDFVNARNQIGSRQTYGGYNPWSTDKRALAEGTKASELVGRIKICDDAEADTRKRWANEEFAAEEAKYKELFPAEFLVAADRKLGTVSLCFLRIGQDAERDFRPGLEVTVPTGAAILGNQGTKQMWMNFAYRKMVLWVRASFTPNGDKPQVLFESRVLSKKDYPMADAGLSEVGQKLVFTPRPDSKPDDLIVAGSWSSAAYKPTEAIPVLKPGEKGPTVLPIELEAHVAQERSKIVSEIAKPAKYLVEAAVAEKLLLAKDQQLRNDFAYKTADVVNGARFAEAHRALSGARRALDVWLTWAALPESAELRSKLTALPDGAAIKPIAEKAYGESLKKAGPADTVLSVELKKTLDATKTELKKAFERTNGKNWHPSIQESLQRLDAHALRHGVSVVAR